jgi:DNA polymerase family B
MIPTETVERFRRNRDRHAKAQARYAYKHRPKLKAKRVATKIGKEFIFWDGESPDDMYSLFGNSVGYEICYQNLSTQDCLELIYDTEVEHPDAIHIAFGFNLDVSYIIKDLPRRHQSLLHIYGKTMWEDWELEHIPHKWFTVRRGNVTAKIYDIHSFFASNYVGALNQFGVGTADVVARIQTDKEKRSEFKFADIDSIREYWQLEISLGPELGNALRHALYLGGNYVPSSWHGPGSIARLALSRHKVYDSMAKCPQAVRLAAQYAFAGGRFEQFYAGQACSTVYEYDINSAYPYFATMLPNLAKGKWRHSRHYEKGKFAVYHIVYDAPYDNTKMYPLFMRLHNNNVCWPNRVDGWFWAPEAELVIDDPYATFKEALIFDEDNPADKPFAFLHQYYLQRKAAKDAGSPAAYAFKTIINAIYGQLAQRAGWDRKHRRAPKSHQLEWAGYITSGCRAAVYRAAMAAGSDNVISINTDSVQTLSPIPTLDCGDGLGQWGSEVWEDGIFWQVGIYMLREQLGYDKELGYGWTKAKTRGIAKGTYTADDLLSHIADREPIKLGKKIFVTYGLADSQTWEHRNTWRIVPHEFKFGGSGKRQHYDKGDGKYCQYYCNGMHQLMQVFWWDVPGRPPIASKKHYLPWLDPPEDTKTLMDDFTLFNADHLDLEDEWVLELGETLDTEVYQ